jgi:hypothetical protein
MEALKLNARKPKSGESLDAYIKAHGVSHFSAREILTLRRLGETVKAPPSSKWPNIIPALLIAENIRAELGCPLIVGNGYRPEPFNSRVGGAKNSQHLHFRALDLDLPRSHRSPELQEEFYRVAAEIYLEHGAALKMGLGLYRAWKGTRVHVDAGYRRRHWKKEFTAPLLDSLK